jgi:aldehyde:ferredoxin oxidoreductase
MMETSCGWSGRILRIDLSQLSYSITPTSQYRDYLGSLGINQYMLLKELPVNADPLSRENVLVFGAGPLVGTNVVASCRMSIGCKNVLTGGVGAADVGGYFASELKFAGYDNIVIKDKAERPVFLYIKDDSIQFFDASHLWGMGTWETSRQIREDLSNPKIRLAAIGPAGENLVKFACIIVDEGRVAGYGGCGAVMGSKNLKAIAVSGSGKISVAHSDYFNQVVANIRKRIDNSSDIKKMRKGGTHYLAGAGGPNSTSPQSTRNLQDEFWSKEKSEKLKEHLFEPYEVKRMACFNCPVRCSHLYEIPAGENKGKRFEGIQSNTVRAFGSNLDNDDPLVLLNANYLCNDLGLDVDYTATVLGWAFECFEKGLLSQQDTDGLQLDWGNGKTILALIRKIALREGFGNLLAQGLPAAARQLGRNSEVYAMHVKGAPINEPNMRIYKGWALGVITSTRGSGHLRGAPNTEQKNIPTKISKRIWGIPNASEVCSYEGRAKLVAWFEAFKALVDSLGLCYFTTYWRDVNLIGPQDLSDLLYGATGLRIQESELLQIGEKIINVEKAFNTLHAGFSREDDLPPERLQKYPVTKGPFKGEYLDKEKWENMLNEYYDQHKWDKVTGWQTEMCLDFLKMPSFVKERLRAQNRLPS